VTTGKSTGEADEKAVLKKSLSPDHCYVMDRGYVGYQLFNAIHAVDSSYVCRARDNSVYEVLDERLLSDEAVAADVLFDAVVQMGTSMPVQIIPGDNSGGTR
jgi:hypothetical protein